jgi:aminoglycoside phosphotransferase (APT) family kinase protein
VAGVAPGEVVETREQAVALPLAPLLVLAPLRAFLDARGLGHGPLRVERLGEGHSNATYLIARRDARWVLRRPPRPPLPPSAHDMRREATVQLALADAGVRVPRVVAVCDDPEVIGAPFYLMHHLAGAVVTDRVPAPLDSPPQRLRIAEELVDALVEIHDVDWHSCGLEEFGRPDGYLERQLRRFRGLWEVNRTRDLPAVEHLATALAEQLPASGAATVVHGDYRLGNVMLAPGPVARVSAVLDWELATIGDPIADLGYLLATWSEPGSPQTPLDLSPVTRGEGFPDRGALAERYASRSGRTVDTLGWYEALALWKAAIFCEAIYGRFLRGERGADDPFGRSLEHGVPQLLAVAASALAGTR